MTLPPAAREPHRVLAAGRSCGHDFMVLHDNHGYRCGYVRVPVGHPWHGLDCVDMPANAHGGLTFHSPDADDGSWWLGFDCAHAGDAPDPGLPGGREAPVWMQYGEVATQEYVEAECRALCWHAARALIDHLRPDCLEEGTPACVIADWYEDRGEQHKSDLLRPLGMMP